MEKEPSHVLLVNPWIDDFAAYDFWAKPIGLLTITSILRMHGYHPRYVDCLDRFHPGLSRRPEPGPFGKGFYLKTRVSKPRNLHDIPRHYSRYGMPENLVRKAISNGPEPAAVLVTSLMTYWYPGVIALIKVVREVFPEVPVVLGGIYATLCHEHAVRHSGADVVLPGLCEAELLQSLGDLTGHRVTPRFESGELDTYPYPAFELQSAIPYLPILTGQGCPFRCAYCASAFLSPGVRRRSPDHVVEEISYWHEKHAVVDFAFYDDALLIHAETHIVPILEGVMRRGFQVRFHTPNAIHIRPLSREVAGLLFRAGFKTVRLGLETAFFDDRQAMDSKVEPDEFEQAIAYLKEAGFKGEDLGAYLLYGLPEQDLSKLEYSIRMVKACGARPILAQYSPIPHTELWHEAVKASRYDLEEDPLFHNNSIFPCRKAPFSWEEVAYFKALVQG
jgi:radical SAM superfamily enzyme YgiQ (UPF0313 family)